MRRKAKMIDVIRRVIFLCYVVQSIREMIRAVRHDVDEVEADPAKCSLPLFRTSVTVFLSLASSETLQASDGQKSNILHTCGRLVLIDRGPAMVTTFYSITDDSRE